MIRAGRTLGQAWRSRREAALDPPGGRSSRERVESIIEGYASATSVRQGEAIEFCVSNFPLRGSSRSFAIAIYRIGAGEVLVHSDGGTAGSHPRPPRSYASGCGWPPAYALQVGRDWPSGPYKAVLADADGTAGAPIHFVVRPAFGSTTSEMVLCWPVTTHQAYNADGGRNLYPTQDPTRARLVSFDRPTPGPDEPELAFWRWMCGGGQVVDCCTSIDLHVDPGLLDRYRLLLSVGHDEYWSKEMRDNVESFIGRGGNAAFFSGNACWWQVRLEDDCRTMVCCKNAIEDPMTGVDDSRVTVNWCSAPVNRPENLMTGVSYRSGAGNWTGTPEARAALATASYRVQAADHWVFEGTGLRNGDLFAAGGVGYETDAAELALEDGVPRPTGVDGTPLDFTVLATADLRDWRRFGVGGHATMGTYGNFGTVFTAATVGWGSALGDPVVATITRNVLARLRQPIRAPAWRLLRGAVPCGEWREIDSAVHLVAMTGMVEGHLFAVTAGGELLRRDPVGDSSPWLRVGDAPLVTAIAAPIEAPIGLFAATSGGDLLWRAPIAEAAPWQRIGAAPPKIVALACPNDLVAATADGELLTRSAGDSRWTALGRAPGIAAMTSLDAKLLAVDGDGRLVCREPVAEDVAWTTIGSAPAGVVAIGAYYGRLFAATRAGRLWWRAAVPDPGWIGHGRASSPEPDRPRRSATDARMK